MSLSPSDAEIDEVLNQCSEQIDRGRSKFPGMTYEEGVQAGIEWALGRHESNPMEE